MVKATEDTEMHDLLAFDPLKAAEETTGKDYQEDKATSGLGFLLLQEHATRTQKVLRARGDTTFRDDLEHYEQVITIYGFRQVLDVPFEYAGLSADASPTKEHLFIYWHDDGLLLVFTTWKEKGVNGGGVYYNWKPTDLSSVGSAITSTGGLREDDIWVGSHDAREALIFNLERLRENGEFVKPWVEEPVIYLRHYGEDRQLDMTEKLQAAVPTTAERLAMLPPDVQEGLGLTQPAISL